MKGLEKSKNVSPWPVGLWHGELLKQPKMAVCGKITPLRVNFHYSSIKVQYRTTIDVFPRISCWSVPLQRNGNSLYPLQITPTLLTAILRHFGPGRKNFNTRSDFGLHTPVKFYPDLLRFAGVIRHIIPSRYTQSVCTVMFHTQTKILNYCWFWANTYAWQRRPTIRYLTAICKVTAGKFTAKLLLLSHLENYKQTQFCGR